MVTVLAVRLPWIEPWVSYHDAGSHGHRLRGDEGTDKKGPQMRWPSRFGFLSFQCVPALRKELPSRADQRVNVVPRVVRLHREPDQGVDVPLQDRDLAWGGDANRADGGPLLVPSLGQFE
jgi:hypothetical protein